jgi:hypothetical protein
MRILKRFYRITVKFVLELMNLFSVFQGDEDSELAPTTSEGGNYEFNQPAQAPEGGFNF